MFIYLYNLIYSHPLFLLLLHTAFSVLPFHLLLSFLYIFFILFFFLLHNRLHFFSTSPSLKISCSVLYPTTPISPTLLLHFPITSCLSFMLCFQLCLPTHSFSFPPPPPPLYRCTGHHHRAQHSQKLS